MHKSCPACGRRNADRAARCLYCGEALQPATLQAPITETPSPPDGPASNRHLVILAPQPDLNDIDGKALAFAETSGLSGYDARLLLRTQRYRLLRKIEGALQAHELSARLRKLGILHFVIAESEVECLQVREVCQVRFHDDRLELGLSEANPIDLAYEDLMLVVRGEIFRERHQERGVGTPRGASQALTPGLRLHLYVNDSHVAPEVDADRFDWSALGEVQTASTPINFKRLIDEILRRADHLVEDRGFDLEPVVLSRSRAVGEIEPILRERGSREGVTYDNEAQFRFYARWRYLVAKADARSR